MTAELNLSEAWHARAAVGPTVSSPSWRANYVRRLVATDLLVLLITVIAAAAARFGMDLGANETNGGVRLSYPELGLILAGAWWGSLQVFETRAETVIGHGTEEYRRVIRATCAAFAGLAVLSVAFKFDASRGYVLMTFPLGLLGLLVTRRMARRRLHRGRAVGEGLTSVLVVGSSAAADHLSTWLGRHPSAGYRVAGCWVPAGDLVGLGEALRESGAEAVVVTDTEELGPDGLRELTWQLDGTGIDLMVAPSVVDVAGSRLSLHDLSGMAMLHVEEPQYAGASRVAKSLFDRIGAALLLLVLSPVMIATAIAVKATSRGPVFYAQERVGLDGRTFRMIKFRSMRVGADAELAALLAAEGKTLAELPKLERDPRLTTVGAFIRRYSIDELPQLLNVLKGDMSLVGPRPQRHFEVEQYDHVATRRLKVRPGMTGLWQVSGRSNLTYADAIRLDLHYVENWSMTADLIILWKTVRAVLASEGAV